MKTTTETKKEYRQPQILEMGDAVESTLALLGNLNDSIFLQWGV